MDRAHLDESPATYFFLFSDYQFRVINAESQTKWLNWPYFACSSSKYNQTQLCYYYLYTGFLFFIGLHYICRVDKRSVIHGLGHFVYYGGG